MLSVTVFNAVVPGSPNVFPIGPAMIASAVRSAGHQVNFVDYQTAKLDADKLDPDTMYRLWRRLPSTDILAIGAMSANLPTVLPAIGKLKRDEPDRIIILGGPGPTDTPRQVLAASPVDYIVSGEGEETIVELLSAIEHSRHPSTVPGAWYRDGNGAAFGGPRPRIRDLDALWAPAYDMVDLADYEGGLHIMTSRGCPYRCHFCSTHTIWGHEVTERSIGSIVNEIDALRDKITWITFCDDNLALKPDRVRSLCQGLREHNLVMPWMTYGRINLTTEELVQDMAEAGCEEVFFGIESGSRRVLEMLEKQIDLNRVRDVIRMTADHVTQVNTSYIWGYPFETVDDLVDTLMAVGEDERQPSVIPHLYLLGPFVNTPLYQKYGDQVRFDPEFLPHVSTVPVQNRLADLPEVLDFIVSQPEIAAPYYHYDHPDLSAKRRIIQRIIDNFQGRSRAVGPHARRERPTA